MKKQKYDEYKTAKKVVLFQLLYHCELMYDYLTETGADVPESIGNKLSTINLKTAPIIAEYNSKNENGTTNEDSEFELHSNIAKILEGDKETLTEMFKDLTTRCKPASPCTLENTIPTSKLFIGFGPKFIRFIRDIWLISLLFLIGYIIFGSLFVSESNKIISEGIKVVSESSKSNYNLLLQLLLFFSSGVGACLYALTASKRYIVARTFDNKYITHYVNRIIIGLITGFILANIIDAPSLNNLSNNNILSNITPSLLALLGGFSAEAVIKILNRLVAMITTLVEGDTKDVIDSRELEIKSKYQAQKVKQNMDYAINLKSTLESAKLDKDSDLYKNIDGVISKMMLET